MPISPLTVLGAVGTLLPGVQSAVRIRPLSHGYAVPAPPEGEPWNGAALAITAIQIRFATPKGRAMEQRGSHGALPPKPSAKALPLGELAGEVRARLRGRRAEPMMNQITVYASSPIYCTNVGNGLDHSAVQMGTGNGTETRRCDYQKANTGALGNDTERVRLAHRARIVNGDSPPGSPRGNFLCRQKVTKELPKRGFAKRRHAPLGKPPPKFAGRSKITKGEMYRFRP